MRRFVVRLFAVVLLLGQVVQVSGGALCGLQRRHHATHCDDAMQQTAGAALSAPSHDMVSGLCALMGPCAPPITAVTAPTVSGFMLAVLRAGPQVAVAQLVSFHPIPIPPPPQV
jgi:hypothetical protein